ncbi:M20/M25/M40 family metallo-hydrolase, partial [Bacillus spizizenii]|nr:M20/M25/M40 family metallo-hydrolase [Bacillus spizizenii]
FGRGTMDMKAGLAVQLSMLERAMNGQFEGNLLLITVPDEEVNSRGMIEAVPILKEMEKK